eukprot:6207433-Pleurochrysis_carterae.AAC.1
MRTRDASCVSTQRDAGVEARTELLSGDAPLPHSLTHSLTLDLACSLSLPPRSPLAPSRSHLQQLHVRGDDLLAHVLQHFGLCARAANTR